MVEAMESHMVEKVKLQVMEKAEAREHFADGEQYEGVEVEQLVLQNYCAPLLSALMSMVRNVMDLQGLWTSLQDQCHHEHQQVCQKLMRPVKEANDASPVIAM